MFALFLCIYRFNANPLRRKKGKMFIIMTSTNQKHEEAVEHVKKKLQDSGSFVSVDKDMRPGVDLYAKRKDGKPIISPLLEELNKNPNLCMLR